MNARSAARVSATVLAAATLFQIAVALGAPFGRFTQGGQVEGALSSTGRTLAVLSAFLLAGMASTTLALVGEGPLRALPRRAIRTIGWLVVAYSAAGTAVNLASPSVLERPWAIATLIVLAGTLRALRATASDRPTSDRPT